MRIFQTDTTTPSIARGLSRFGAGRSAVGMMRALLRNHMPCARFVRTNLHHTGHKPLPNLM
jgi:hypothetical protein